MASHFQVTEMTEAQRGAQRREVFDAFRRWGYLQANLDPLGQYFNPERLPELDLEGEAADEARRYYCGTIGAEFMHIPDARRREWLQRELERETEAAEQRRALDLLVKADVFEQFIQGRYLGTKRFSLEGLTALIPMLDEMANTAADLGVEKAVLAMSHRGRLNVMVNTVGIPASSVFAKFEDVDPRSVLGGGDVKYHIGATGTFRSRNGKEMNLHLVSNPSHLEAVDPVAMGRTRAKQMRYGKIEDGWKKVLEITMHGDAAFAGQGIWAETLDLASVDGFSVGGSVHIVLNNLVGFTANPSESNSSRFSSDVAKRLPIPILHVNAEDTDAVVRVASLAVRYRAQFQSDIVIDLIGYRRHGHSEVDDPTITQPRRYAIIKDHPPLFEIYAKQMGVDAAPLVEAEKNQLMAAQNEAAKLQKMPDVATLPQYWSRYKGGLHREELEVDTGVPAAKLAQITEKVTTAPAGFNIHPKIAKLLQQRAEMGTGKRPVDYGMAEQLAFGSLLLEGIPVRLSGQDSQRGTFNQRHSVLVDIETEERYFPLCHLAPQQAWFEIYNSILSEAGVLGFEYGFSRDFPEALVLWEAQFGDFANGAQIIVDQFISSAEDKWGLLSGIVMLLPHGYEGQGPEHSSARIERYLQLAARHNMQICQPSSAAQYFHLLRRQALRDWRKPLICFTPKAMLRHPEASSSIEEFSAPRFRDVVGDAKASAGSVSRVLLCTGKIGHELKVERARRKQEDTAIVMLDQLYPWPEHELEDEIARFGNAHEIVWVQEEPANMGALNFVMPHLRRMFSEKKLMSVKRSESGSPATGSAKAHTMEQKTLLELAFSAAH